ncbi:RagB/SusD family nutrient uptake outer membrane protein [Chitinophaga rhizosphaerae]|uniref:RagB/SusD family nutrient uptake outer membrane protein n=1 Tax=Chitinophaga rhizosphaerae TaxID=1864947 RepID=UPI0013DFF5DF|nr:RagB/SusD family nutrient uptake outer membrane protein [Chitinophaga rhizosphaerae]
MKKWLKIGCVAGLIAGAGLSACKNFLDVKPNDSFTGADYWRNATDAQMGVNAAYSLLRDQFTRCIQYNYGDFRPGNYDFWNKNNFRAIAQNDLRSPLIGSTDGAQVPREGWDVWYKSIAAANLAVARISAMNSTQISESEKAQLVGEARFVRAYDYYCLVQSYGSVPFQFSPYDIEMKPKTDQVKILDSCILDLRLAADALPVSYNDPTFRAVRATKGAALTLMAHMYMWQAGFDKGRATELNRNAAAVCKEVMDLNIYKLLPYEEELFHTIFKGRSEEGIWEISMDVNYGNVTGNFISQWVLHQPVIASSSTLYGGLGSEITVKREYMDILYPPGESDKRFDLWFEDPYNTVNPQSQMFLKFSSVSDPVARRYDANMIIFRYSGLLLLRAEALANIGQDGDARELLNEIRRRAQASEVIGLEGPALKDAIFLERTRELWGEGHRWYDLVRTGRVTDFSQCENALTQDQYERGAWTWPIPISAMRRNPKITQTAFWAQ